MIQTTVSFESSTFVNIYIILWVTRCDMFQYLRRPSTNCGFWEMFCCNRGEESAGSLGLSVYHGITSNQKKGGKLVQWRSSRQDLIAKSTCEAELIASTEALQQGENIAIVVAEMTNKSCEIEASSDNAASLHMIRNGSETAWRTRHISVKALWMHQMARRGIKFTYQPTAKMAADSLTKGLGASRLPQIREDLCLIED